jgi:hypothetical protein
MGEPDRLADANESASLTNFDLAAAWLRHAEADRGAFFNRFVAIVSQALPHHTQIEKVRHGLFRKTEEVVGIAVAFENETYLMRLNNGHHLTTQIEKKVRGVVLSTRETDAREWMTGLMTHVRERTDQARSISELLGTL